jgi:hypothetical protein
MFAAISIWRRQAPVHSVASRTLGDTHYLTVWLVDVFGLFLMMSWTYDQIEGPHDKAMVVSHAEVIVPGKFVTMR